MRMRSKCACLREKSSGTTSSSGTTMRTFISDRSRSHPTHLQLKNNNANTVQVIHPKESKCSGLAVANFPDILMNWRTNVGKVTCHAPGGMQWWRKGTKKMKNLVSKPYFKVHKHCIYIAKSSLLIYDEHQECQGKLADGGSNTIQHFKYISTLICRYLQLKVGTESPQPHSAHRSATNTHTHKNNNNQLNK